MIGGDPANGELQGVRSAGRSHEQGSFGIERGGVRGHGLRHERRHAHLFEDRLAAVRTGAVRAQAYGNAVLQHLPNRGDPVAQEGVGRRVVHDLHPALVHDRQVFVVDPDAVDHQRPSRQHAE